MHSKWEKSYWFYVFKVLVSLAHLRLKQSYLCYSKTIMTINFLPDVCVGDAVQHYLMIRSCILKFPDHHLAGLILTSFLFTNPFLAITSCAPSTPATTSLRTQPAALLPVKLCEWCGITVKRESAKSWEFKFQWMYVVTSIVAFRSLQLFSMLSCWITEEEP